MTTWIVLLCWTACFALLNYGAKALAGSLPPLSSSTDRILGYFASSAWSYVLVVLYVACAGLYLWALRILPLSVAGPAVTLLGALTTFGLGICLFQEAVTFARVLGAALAIAGIALLTR